MHIAFQQMQRGRGSVLRRDHADGIPHRLAHSHGVDFYEGVRAVIIGKDNAPRWSPPTLGGVQADAIDAYFARSALTN